MPKEEVILKSNGWLLEQSACRSLVGCRCTTPIARVGSDPGQHPFRYPLRFDFPDLRNDYPSHGDRSSPAPASPLPFSKPAGTRRRAAHQACRAPTPPAAVGRDGVSRGSGGRRPPTVRRAASMRARSEMPAIGTGCAVSTVRRRPAAGRVPSNPPPSRSMPPLPLNAGAPRAGRSAPPSAHRDGPRSRHWDWSRRRARPGSPSRARRAGRSGAARLASAARARPSGR